MNCSQVNIYVSPRTDINVSPPSIGEEVFSRCSSVIFFPFTCTVILQCQVPFYTESYLLLFFLLYFLRTNQESGWLVSAIQWRTSTNINGRSAATMWPAGEAGILTSPFKKWSQKHFKTPTYSTQIPPIPVSHLTYFLLFPKMFFSVYLFFWGQVSVHSYLSLRILYHLKLMIELWLSLFLPKCFEQLKTVVDFFF